jgi:hypothetical protein
MATYSGSDKRLKYLFQNGGGGGGSCKVISGYYHNGSFYEDQSYTQIITGDTECLYIDLDTTTLYLFDGTDYVEVQGGSGGSTVTITPTLSTGTKIADYSIDGASGSLYAPNGGASSLDGLTDVTITTPTDGQALLYDSATGEWVNGTVSGGGGSEGTAGLSIDISLGSGQSITYSRTDLNITRKGCYLFSITSGHNAWMEYLGYFFYGGHYPGYQVSGIFSIRSSYLTVSYADGQNGTFTIKNTSGYGENQRIEILPLHPKVEIPKHTYSTTEQVVGTWIDGKPIYELTTLLPITYAPQTGGAQNAGNQVISVANVGLITDLKVLPLSPSTASHIQTCRTSPFQVSVTDVHAYSDRIQLNQMTFAANLTWVGVSGVYVIVQYTKTTD